MSMKERVTRRKEGKSPSSVQCAFHAITVGSGRHAEPYIIAFHYTSDNVAGRPLGTLFGFFEVEIHDEDAAYIVNFLASVAKKEYFTNPRRDVADGFETTLHKVNVALSEIAKEGNISWLGHLHGILGAVSDNTVHFSATGDGVLALVRDNTLRPISDGLAETSSEPHPLKTFTEVSSGKLIEGDVLLALSPAVWTLFTPEDLKKNLHRLGQKGFEQFLHTALVNELPLAGAVVVNVSAAPLPKVSPEPTKEKSENEDTKESSLLNAWSGQVFEKARSARFKSFAAPKTGETGEERKEEYIDKKTGHIYVQGEEEIPVTDEPWKARLALWSHSFSQQWQINQEKFRRFSRRSRKSIAFLMSDMSEGLSSSGRRGTRRLRSFFRRLEEARAAKKEAPAQTISQELPNESSPSTPPLSEERSSFSVREKLSQFSFPSLQKPNITIPSLPKESLRNFTDTSRRFFHQLWETSKRITIIGSQKARLFWQAQSTRNKKIITGGGIAAFTLILGMWFYLDRSPLWEATEETAPSLTETTTPLTPSSPLDNEPLAVRLNENRSLSSLGGESIALGIINDIPFDIRSERVTNLQSNESSSFPEPIRLAAAMDDLDAIFLVGQSNALYIYTIANKKIEQNSLPLPSGGNIDAIGTYLTYLYVLDRKAGAIYRFPRTEGGFGEAVTWSRENLSVHPTSPLSVFENVAVVLPDGKPALYSRGRKAEIAFNGPQAPLEIKTLTINAQNGDLLALDRKEKRVIRWSSTGSLLAQYFHDSFAEASAIAITKNNELLVDRPTGTFSFQLP